MTEANGIIEETNRRRWVLRTDDGEAELVYAVDGNRLVLVHTEVPEALGGRGIAGQLVRTAVDRAATTGETVLPSCSYARTWLEEHPEDASRITIDWTTEPE